MTTIIEKTQTETTSEVKLPKPPTCEQIISLFEVMIEAFCKANDEVATIIETQDLTQYEKLFPVFDMFMSSKEDYVSFRDNYKSNMIDLVEMIIHHKIVSKNRFCSISTKAGAQSVLAYMADICTMAIFIRRVGKRWSNSVVLAKRAAEDKKKQEEAAAQQAAA